MPADKNIPKEYNPGYKDKECITEMVDKYGSANVAVFCLLNAYKLLFRAGRKEGETYESALEKAEWYYNYAERLGVPFIDMTYWQLKNDIKLKLLKGRNKLNDGK